MIIAVALVLAQATSAVPVTPDVFASLRSIIAPSLNCERGFDVQRRKFLDEKKAIDKLANHTQEENRLVNEALDSLQERDQQFRTNRAAKCRLDVYGDRLKVRLRLLQPKLTPDEIRWFTVGFYNDLRQMSEFAADFSAGYDFQQYTPPPAFSPRM